MEERETWKDTELKWWEETGGLEGQRARVEARSSETRCAQIKTISEAEQREHPHGR